nr:hypothetical protein [Tanacetum cinerariifolium]
MAAAAAGKATAVAVAPTVVAGVSGGCGGIAVEVVARGVGASAGGDVGWGGSGGVVMVDLWCGVTAVLHGSGEDLIVYIRDLVGFSVTIHIITILKSEMRTSETLLTLMIWFQLLERDKLGGAVEASKRRRSMLDYRIQQLSNGSIQDVSNDEENKGDAEVIEKQARNVQTSLTLSSAELKTQSMMDVPIHQKHPAV